MTRRRKGQQLTRKLDEVEEEPLGMSPAAVVMMVKHWDEGIHRVQEPEVGDIRGTEIGQSLGSLSPTLSKGSALCVQDL
jgi:hypothetical protein